MADGFIERAGVRLHYVEWPAPTPQRPPAVFLLHGLSSNALVWSRLAPLLRGRRVVALDQRSHGLSDRPETGYSAAELVADAAHAITALDLGRPLVAGHSWGATVALELAATHPELASGLVFVDGPSTAMSGAMTWEEAANRMQPPLPVYPDLEGAAAVQHRYLGESWGEDLNEFVRSGVVAVDGGFTSTLTAPVRLQVLKAMFHHQPELLFPQVAGPVLLAAAATDYPGAPAQFLDWRRRSVDAVRQLRADALVRWYDSRHDIPLIRPEELAADLERLAIAAGWYEVTRLASGVDGDWNRPVHGDAGGWNARDLLAHLAASQASMSMVLAAPPPAGEAIEASPRPAFDPDRWNASQTARRREHSPAALLEEMRQGSVAIAGALLETDLARPAALGPYAGRPLGEVMGRMLEHQRSHLAELS